MRDQSEYWQEPGKFAIYGSPTVQAGFARRYNAVLDHAQQAAGAVGSILDLGCGTGNFLDFAQRRGIRAVGLDLDAKAVETARARNLDAYTVDELQSVGSNFDALSMWDVVEHLIDPVSTLRTVLPRVRDGGLLLFETPDGGFVLRRLILLLHAASRGRCNLTRPMYYWEHKIYFTERGFRALMRRLSCEVVLVQRATSVREKMSEVFAAGAGRNGRAGGRVLSMLWPVLEALSRRVGLGNKLLVVGRRTTAVVPEDSSDN